MAKNFLGGVRNIYEGYYYVARAANGLDYAKLLPAGIKQVVKNYKKYKGYEIDIDVAFYRAFDRKDFLDCVKRTVQASPNEHIRGVIAVAESSAGGLVKYGHTSPIVIAKNAGKVALIDFEAVIEKKADSEKYDLSFVDTLKNISNYVDMQKDFESCAVFSLVALECSLRSENFRKFCFDEKEKTIKVDISLGQGSEYIEDLSYSKRKKFVHEIAVGANTKKTAKVNLEAFYMGHNLALSFNSQHLNEVSLATAELYLKIDSIKEDEVVDDKNPSGVLNLSDVKNMDGISGVRRI